MDTLLVLDAHPDLEEDLVDYLLDLDCIGSFITLPVRGHGSRGAMSPAEQVSGRQKRLLVQIMLDAAAVDEVIGGLASNVGRDINWRQQAVIRSGRVG
jgi:hypothetical protein